MADKTAEKKQKTPQSKLDLATLLGLVLALGGILGGLLLEGGSVKDVAQITAAIIVLGGTLGAVMVTTAPVVLMGAARKLSQVFIQKTQEPGGVIEEIIMYATKARKGGIVSLEQEVEAIQDPFLKKALTLAVDGTDLKDLRRMMELEITLEEQSGEAEAKVYEAAGGYSPTIGIIGAVLGLIQVMKHLENIEEVGKGIAVAFVATVYGVGVANVFFLPAGNKLKARTHESVRMKELILEGVAGIVEGLNPKLLRSKLEAYTRQEAAAKAAKAAKAKGKKTAAVPAAPAAAKG